MTKRRKLLKGIGVLGITGVAQPVTALEGNEELNYRGVTYDSTTQQVQGECSAKVTGGRNQELLLNIPSHEVTFDIENIMKGDGTGKASGLTEDHNLDDKGGEILIRSVFKHPYYIGYITKRSREYGNLGFTMVSSESDLEVNSIKGAVSNNAESKDILSASGDKTDIPDVPAKGIPKNTAMKNVVNKQGVLQNE